MTSAADDDEGKYTLDYFTPGEGAPEEPPFKYRTFYLDDALAEAWRIARGGGAALRVARGREPVFDGDELKKACEMMSELGGERPGRGERELAALVLEELGKAGPQP